MNTSLCSIKRSAEESLLQENGAKGTITSKVKHAIKLKASPARPCATVAALISNNAMFWLSDGEEIMAIAFFVLIQYRSVTDGQTDRQTDRRTSHRF